MSNPVPIRLARQGDILIERVDSLPEGLEPESRDDLGRFVLAHGERHDHTHAIRSPSVCAFRLKDGYEIGWIEVGGAGAVLTHEYSTGAKAEHEPVDLPPGVYRVIRQREYVDRWPVRVGD